MGARRLIYFLIPALIAFSPPARAASFDCTLARLTAQERAICDNRDLNDADVEMVTMLRFLTGLFAMGTRGEIMDAQADWLHERGRCGTDLVCLRAAYAHRISELQAIYNEIDRPL